MMRISLFALVLALTSVSQCQGCLCFIFPCPSPPPPSPSPPTPSPDCECGKRKTGKIVGGEDADKGEFPWQVALVLNSRSQCSSCELFVKIIIISIRPMLFTFHSDMFDNFGHTGCLKKNARLWLTGHREYQKWTINKSRVSFEKFRKFPLWWAQKLLISVRKWLSKMSPKMPAPLEKRHAFGSH